MSVPIIGYSAEERESVINYDYEKKVYHIYTNAPTHITKCMKQYSDYNIEIISVTPSGDPSCILIRNIPNAITFRNPKKRDGGVGNPNFGKFKKLENDDSDITE